jgi:Na+/proline symporter
VKLKFNADGASKNIANICFVYFIGLLVISYFTSRNSDNQSFFIGNKKSKWWLVAFGMIGTSLSGVTFISVPGTVGKMTAGNYPFGGFEYYMMVIGFLLAISSLQEFCFRFITR